MTDIALGKFVYENDDGDIFTYEFEQNPELPFKVYPKIFNANTFRLNNGSLKYYDGYEKYMIDLDFQNITELQKNKLMGFNRLVFDYYIIGDETDFIAVSTLASDSPESSDNIILSTGTDNFQPNDRIKIETSEYIIKLITESAGNELIQLDRPVAIHTSGLTIYKKNYYTVKFKNEPQPSLDVNDRTYTMSINLEEV